MGLLRNPPGNYPMGGSDGDSDEDNISQEAYIRFRLGRELRTEAIELLSEMKIGELQRFVDWYAENKDSDNLPWLEV